LARSPYTAQDHEANLARAIVRRQSVNERVWKGFLRSGLPEAWRFVFGTDPQKPDTSVEESVFRHSLLLNEPNAFFGAVRGTTELERRYWIRFNSLRQRAVIRAIAYGRLQNGRWDGASERRARMVLAYPTWADRDQIRAIYKTMRELNKAAGCIAYHVDHIVPLAHPFVSGLHVHWNLRIIPAKENLEKHNQFDPVYDGVD